MINVSTDHYIEPRGTEQMVLTNGASGPIVVTADRVEGKWLLSAKDTPGAIFDTRQEAVTGMTELALAVLGGTGYSTFVPPEIVNLS